MIVNVEALSLAAQQSAPLQKLVVVCLQIEAVRRQVAFKVVRAQYFDYLEQLIFVVPAAEEVFPAEDLVRSGQLASGAACAS